MIRLWKLGSLEHNIYPSKKAVKKLREAIEADNEGVLDLIWGPDLTVEIIPDEGENFILKPVRTEDGDTVFALDLGDKE